MPWRRQVLVTLQSVAHNIRGSSLWLAVGPPCSECRHSAQVAFRTTPDWRPHLSKMSFASQPEAQIGSSPVHFDSSAVQRLQELVRETPGQVLRVSVDAGGCSGFQYVFSMDSTTNEDDIVYDQDGVSLAVDKVSYEFLKGATVEYAEDLISSSFRVKDNPNSDLSCGCGSSFSAKMD